MFSKSCTVRSLGRTFTIWDSDNNRLIDKQEFYWGLKNLGCNISKREACCLLEYLDTSKDGYVDFNEFLLGVRGSPSEARQKVIDAAFEKFDIYKVGNISATELAQVFDCPDHPQVQAGDCTVNDVFVQFLACFGDKNNNGMISRDSWNDHYAAVSAQVQSDDVFCQLMTSTWKL